MSLIVFGDSFSDGGVRGYGIAGKPVADGYPALGLQEPLRRIREALGSAWPPAELGYFEGCYADGLTWPHLVGLRVWNFAHAGATTCQDLEVPEGYVAMPSSTEVAGNMIRPRGIAQQIRQAATLLPEHVWREALIVLGPLCSDVVLHGARGMGSCPEEASSSPLLQNTRQALMDLKRLGVKDWQIILAGVPALDLHPLTPELESDRHWWRSQIAAVNACFDKLGYTRWHVEELMRSFFKDEVQDYYPCAMYTKFLPTLRSKQDLELAANLVPVGSCFFWDEFHPSAALHHFLAEGLRQLFDGTGAA